MIEKIIILIGINFLIFLSKNLNLIKIMMFFESIFLLGNLIIANKCHLINSEVGLVFFIAVLSVAACETSIGLGLLVVFYKKNHSIEIESLNKLGEDKWLSAF
jgi:NADH-quinone oxidoreductase subunit K